MFHTRWVSSARTSMDASTIQTRAGKAADYGRQQALARYSITKEAPPRDRRSTRSRCVLIRSRGNGAPVARSRSVKIAKSCHLFAVLKTQQRANRSKGLHLSATRENRQRHNDE